ncbi:MAG: RNA polymerase sigma factor [Pirellulales bacterium]
MKTANDKSLISDEQLLLDYRETGNPTSFETLVHRYEREMYGFLRRFLHDAELAEDAFQATFLQLHLKCEQFQADRKLRPWLYRMAKNQAIDLVRRNRRHQLTCLADRDSCEDYLLPSGVSSTADDPYKQLHEMDERAWLHDTARQLPKSLRQIVTLVYFEGLKYREAAEVLSIPLGTLKSRMHRALELLKQQCATGIGAAA